MLSRFSRVQLFETPGLWPTRLLCPWDSPGQNTGVGCHALLQENQFKPPLFREKLCFHTTWKYPDIITKEHMGRCRGSHTGFTAPSSGPHLIKQEPHALCAHDGLGLQQVPQVHVHFSPSPPLRKDQCWQPAQAACGKQARDPPLDLSAPGTVLRIIFRPSIMGQTVYPPPPNSYVEVLVLSASECNHIWR